MASDRTLMRSVVSSAGRTKSDRHIVKQMDVYTYCPMSWLDHSTALSSATFIVSYLSVTIYIYMYICVYNYLMFILLYVGLLLATSGSCVRSQV